jgi:antitoxin ParD1/3/4
MAKRVQKISIALPTEMVDHIRAAVDSGQYASVSEVVREAVREWEGPPRREPPRTKEELRRSIALAIESLDRGEGIAAEDVYAAMRARIKEVAAGKKRK